MNENLKKARELLDNFTPLKTDCGWCCGAACCRDAEGEVNGMLLFPGEEDFYEDMDGYTLQPVPQGTLLVCSGKCVRQERPLSCRIFPLFPVIRDGQVKAVTDQRAKGICPLGRQGKSALDPEFIRRVQEVGELLAKDDIQRQFMEDMTAEQDELRELRKKLGM